MCNKETVRPFIKWAGGKTQLLPYIRKFYPEELGGGITKYAEPFLGGGAVLFDILSHYNLESYYVSDINKDLINTYINIRDNLSEMLSRLSILEKNYLTLNLKNKKIYYYQKRNRYNYLKRKGKDSVEISALFIFLNKTCFNGLYRVNNKGEFNVPIGDYKNPTIYNEDNLREASKQLQKVKIVCSDYKSAERFIDSKTFVYFDPPYRPISSTANFTTYSKDGFSDKEQIKLAQFIDRMSEKGAYVITSNSDPKNINENDDFFDNLYKKHKIYRVNANRMINSVKDNRGLISELLIVTQKTN